MNTHHKILNIATLTFEAEINSLRLIQEQLGEDFVQVVECILETRGHLVITGVGKSALMARKIVATLNSTGTKSLFLHTSDALHGDLGMIDEKDIVICISKSGETQEIKTLIPILQRKGNILIAMTSQRESYLAKKAHHLLYVPIIKEADPENLVPTSSTTAQLVMGDALAICLMSSKGFNADDFSKIHPAGMLGKRLLMRVEDIFPTNNKPSVKPNDTIRNVIVSMTTGRLGITVVVDEKQKTIGVITDGDLRRMLEKSENWKHLKATDIMTHSPKTISKNNMATEALKKMNEYNITQLIVEENNKYQGVIHLHDLIKEGFVE